MDVVVVGAGPAGLSAALRAAELGARTVLVTRDEFGGMAANDGPHSRANIGPGSPTAPGNSAAERYGIAVGEPILEYPRLLARAREVVHDVCEHSIRREQIERAEVTIYERSDTARFVDPHTIETDTGLRLPADKVILCAGGTSRRLPIPAFEWTATHSDAWSLTTVPPSMLIIGAGATGVQVASIFQAFGSRVQLFPSRSANPAHRGRRLSAAVAVAFRESGMVSARGLRNHPESFREDAEWCANGLLERAHAK